MIANRFIEFMSDLESRLDFANYVKDMKDVKFISRHYCEANKCEHYVNSKGIVLHNVGMGYIEVRKASESDLKTYPVII